MKKDSRFEVLGKVTMGLVCFRFKVGSGFDNVSRIITFLGGGDASNDGNDMFLWCDIMDANDDGNDMFPGTELQDPDATARHQHDRQDTHGASAH